MYTVKIYWPEYGDPNNPLVCRTSQFRTLEDAQNEVYRYRSRCKDYRCEIENRRGDVLVYSKGNETLYKHQGRKPKENNTGHKGDKEDE